MKRRAFFSFTALLLASFEARASGLGPRRIAELGGGSKFFSWDARLGTLPSGSTFTRTSGGMTFDVDGVLKWGAENIIPNSANQLAATWTYPAASAVAGATVAPDGSLMTSLIEDTTATTVHIIRPTAGTSFVAGYTYTLSFYAKAGLRNWVYLQLPSAAFTSALRAWFDLTNGVTGVINAPATATIQAVGGGIYRISLTATATTTASGFVNLGITTANNIATYTGDGVSNALIWGMQVQRTPSQNTAFIATGAASYFGPRFYYDPANIGTAWGYLSEQQSTNLFLQSQTITGTSSSFGVTRSSVTANATTSPDGTANAAKVVEDATAASTHRLTCATVSSTSGVTYTYSTFAKAAERTWIALRVFSTALLGTSAQANFNLSNGTIGTVDAGLTAAIAPSGNGWYRCSVSFVAATSQAGGGSVTVDLATANNTTSYTGDGASGVYIWGLQFESGGLTSLIPTSTATATRAQDILTTTPASIPGWNSSAGVLVAAYRILGAHDADFPPIITLTDGTTNNQLTMSIRSNGLRGFRTVANAGTNQIAIDNGAEPAVGVRDKFAVGWSLTHGQSAYNGGNLSVVNGAYLAPAGLNTFQIGRNGSVNLNGTIESFVYYAGARSDGFALQVSK